MLTDEQKELRLGRFAASSIHKIMGARGLGKTGETYIYEKAAEHLTGVPGAEAYGPAIDWGNEHEEEATRHFYHATDYEVIPNIESRHNEQYNFAYTVDAFLKADSVEKVLETKCPYNSAWHLKLLKLDDKMNFKALKPEWFWQIVAYAKFLEMDVVLASYDPRFSGTKKMAAFEFTREMLQDDIELFTERLIEANKIFNELIS